MAKSTYILILFIVVLLPAFYSKAEDRPWEVTILNNPAPGYLKFDWINEDIFCLWDNYGNKQYINNPNGFNENAKFKLLQNGLWICQGTRVPGIEKFYLFNQDMILIDSIPLLQEYTPDYHEVEVMTNGHYLILYMDYVTVDMSKIVSGGNPNALITNSIMVETDTDGNIYWEWSSLDHLQITDATPDIDLTQFQIDFAHINSYCETPDGNLLVSFRHLDEVTKINKSTGEIIWRLGGEKCKNNEFTFLNDENNGFIGFSHQHTVSVLENGNILMYDNGNLREPQFSRAVEYQVNETNKTVTKAWEYRYTPDIFIASQGSAFRLPNGNTLINWGEFKITEVKPDNTIAFEMNYHNDNPVGSGIVYRAYRIATNMSSASRFLNSNGTFNFNGQDNITGVTLNITNILDEGTLSVEKHSYQPPKPTFNDKLITQVLPFRWVIGNNGISSLAGIIKLKLSTLDFDGIPSKVRIYKRDKESVGVFNYLETNYNSATGEVEAPFTGFGEFVLCLNDLKAPAIVYPTDKGINTTVAGTFKWDSAKCADRYQLQLDINDSFSETILDEIIENNLYFDYKALKYNTRYYIRLRSINPGDTSEWSGVNSFMTLNVPTTKLLYPQNTRTGVKNSDSLLWVTIPGCDGYKLWISGTPDFSILIADTVLTGNCFYLSGLNYNTKYYWKVIAYQGDYYGDWSEIYSFTTTLQPPVLTYPPADTTNQPLTGKLFWSTVTGSISYYLEISQTEDFKSVVLSQSGITSKNYQYNNLEPFSEYYWRVKACRSYDTSGWSSVNKFTTMMVAPVNKFPGNGSNKLPLQVLFQWDSIRTAGSYLFKLSLNIDFKSCITDTSYLKNTTCFVENLPPNKQLFWMTAARYGDSVGIWSNIQSFTTGEKQPPARPELLSPANSANVFSEVELQWKDPLNSNRYGIQLAKDQYFSNIIFDSVVVNSTVCKISELDYNTKYYWRAKTTLSDYSSLWTESWSFTTMPEKVRLIYPANEQSQIPVTGKFGWSDIQGTDYYQIQVCTDQNFNDKYIDTLVSSSNVLNYYKLDFNKYYYWRARYGKNGRFSNWSNTYWFISESKFPLATPVLLSPNNEDYGELIDGFVAWKTVPDADSYRVTIARDIDFEDIIVSQPGLTETIYYHPVLDYNQIYYWRITAFNDNASSPWTEIRRFVTELERPKHLEPFDSSQKQPVEGYLRWNSVNTTNIYNLQISESVNFSTNICDTKINADTVYKYKLQPSKKYFWRVKSLTELNFSRWSRPWSFDTGDYTSEIIHKDSNLLPYPLPATEYIYLKGDISEELEYKIYTFEGVILESGIVSTKRINISNLPSGSYFLWLNGKFHRFIKLH